MEDIKSSIGVREIKNYKPLLQQLFAEALGTFLYLTIVPLADQEREFSVVSVGLSNGLLVGTIVQIVGNVSGGHINPAVTLGAMLCGQIKVLRALCYIAAQVLGGFAGAATSYALLNEKLQRSFGGIIRHQHCAIFFLECILTFMLVAVALSVTDIRRGSRGLGSAPLAIGLCLTACESGCNFYTVGLNPVRMLSPAVVASWSETDSNNKDWSRIWIYCVAPLVGGVVSGLVYRYVLNLKLQETVED